MRCVACGKLFTRTNNEIRCHACQIAHNKAVRLAAAKAVQAKRRDHPLAPPMPKGYVDLKAWCAKCNRSVARAQTIMSRSPELIPAAIKVRNPRGGVDIWAVPEDTIWPY